MKKLRIGIIDIVSKGPTRALYARIMNASLASIMPQVIGVWCQEEGHEVTFVCYTGFEDLLTELPDNVDVVFIGAFTEAAHTAYALSNLFRGRGAITVIGGPHARCYPEDAARYFDYVLASRIRVRSVTSCGTARNTGPRASTSRPPSSPEPSPGYASVGSLSTPRSAKRRSSRWSPCSAAWGARTLAPFVSMPRSPTNRWTSKYSARISGSC